MDYSRILSEKVVSLKPSGIRKFFDLLDTMDDVVSLTVGQPDFTTPFHICEAGIDSIVDGKTYYTSNKGLFQLREAVSGYLSRRFALEYDAKDEIMITVGGSEAIDVAIRSMIDPGDEVVIPVPSFVCYEPLVRMAGGEPVLIETNERDEFRLTPAALKRAITNRTKLLIMPFPDNPTGAVMGIEELNGIADVVNGTEIMILSDEIYAELTYGRKHVSVASLYGMRQRTVVVSGLSKSHAMTGWRIGYTAAPREIMQQMLKIHQYAIMCAPTASQYAAVSALNDGDGDVEYMKEEYNRRRRYILNGLRSIGLRCFEPKGAFYVYPYIGDCGMTSEQFCEKLLYEEKVAVVPGTAFGDCGEGYVRMSYAYSVDHITMALERLEQFLNKIKKPL